METTTKTDYILVKAQTNSEWDNCDFAIITIPEEQKVKFKKLAAKVAELKEIDSSVSEITVYCIGDFYTSTEDNEQISEFIEEGEEFIFIDALPENLTPPESRLDCHMAKISEKYIRFSAYGKHTGEEFWTSDILIESL